jgi:hypothetical protein
MPPVRKKFTTQVDPEVLSALRALAKREGRQIQVLVDEALSDLIAKRKNGRPRRNVMDAYRASRKIYGEVYRKLA